MEYAIHVFIIPKLMFGESLIKFFEQVKFSSTMGLLFVLLMNTHGSIYSIGDHFIKPDAKLIDSEQISGFCFFQPGQLE